MLVGRLATDEAEAAAVVAFDNLIFFTPLLNSSKVLLHTLILHFLPQFLFTHGGHSRQGFVRQPSHSLHPRLRGFFTFSSPSLPETNSSSILLPGTNPSLPKTAFSNPLLPDTVSSNPSQPPPPASSSSTTLLERNSSNPSLPETSSPRDLTSSNAKLPETVSSV